jgi:hypothetical protein
MLLTMQRLWDSTLAFAERGAASVIRIALVRLREQSVSNFLPNTRQRRERPITGQGGHQSFFARLKPTRDGVAITYSDFSFARARAAMVHGGWLIRYQTILTALGPIVEAAGTTRALFNLRRAVRS